MNPFYMPIEQRKAQEFRSFAKLVVYAVATGFFIAIILHFTGWGS